MAPASHVVLSLMLLSSQRLLGVDSLTEKVLVVSFDGFRWDYLDLIQDLGSPHFNAFKSAGTHAHHMIPTFATFTFPSHYTMATGLYEETHGVVSNYMYDPTFRDNFSPFSKETKWWNGGEPIWITAVRNGKRSGCFYWPGSETEIQGYRATVWETYNKSRPFPDRVDHVVNWLRNEEVDIAMLYFHEPDAAGHSHGPQSPEVRLKVKEMDGILGYLETELWEAGLRDLVNVIVVSDHGMTDVGPDKLVQIPNYLNMELVEDFEENGAVCHVFPKPGKLQEIYDQLVGRHPSMHVVKATEMEERWHYSQHRRIGPVLIIMDEHWACTLNLDADWNRSLGGHGYYNDLESMRPIFMARGPDIKEGHEIKPFQQVDIYPLLSELLHIPPSSHNGSLERVIDILRDSPAGGASGVQSPKFPIITIAFFVCAAIAIIL